MWYLAIIFWWWVLTWMGVLEPRMVDIFLNILAFLRNSGEATMGMFCLRY